jgi:hypothetical protein
MRVRPFGSRVWLVDFRHTAPHTITASQQRMREAIHLVRDRWRAQQLAKGQCAGIVRDGPSLSVCDGAPEQRADLDSAHGCAPSRTVRTPPPLHSIQEVGSSTLLGSIYFAGLAF